LVNVGEFKAGKDGKHWIDMDVEIKDDEDNVVFAQEQMLGENGKVKLENNTAGNPYAEWHTTPDIKTGTYKFRIKIYDKIGNGQAIISKNFNVE